MAAAAIAMMAAMALAPSAAHAQAVDLRGLVVDAQGKALPKAIVALRDARTATGDVRDTTDAQGRFRLFVPAGQLGISLRGVSMRAPQGGRFGFSLAARGSVRLSVRGADGRLLAPPFSATLAAGEYLSDLRGLRAGTGSRMAWLVLEAAGASRAFPLPPAWPEEIAGDAAISVSPVPASSGAEAASLSAGSPTGSAAAKRAAGADLLTASLPGYQTASVPVSAMVDTMKDIRLSPLDYPAVLTPGIDFIPPGRRPQEPGMPAWVNAGMMGGYGMPDDSCIKRTLDAAAFGVIADDGKDDAQALQSAIDAVPAGGAFNDLTLIKLPAGRIDIARQIWVDKDFVILRGAGSDPAAPGSTRIVFRPDADTRYDKPSADGTLPGMDEMTDAGNTAKWFWPGRGLFRVQTREVHPDYAKEFAAAPLNRKDIYQGSINYHWKSGIKVSQAQPYAAKAGERVIRLDGSKKEMQTLKPGDPLWVGAANSQKMYLEQGVPQTEYWENMHMKARVHYIVAVDAAAKTVTVDAPLEFDIPANNTSDGSPALLGTTYYSRVMPMKAVQGVGFERFYATLDLKGLPRLDGKGAYAGDPHEADFNYGNIAPEYALHGIVFKWAANCWARDLNLYMMGSHPLVTEVAKNIEVAHNRFEGSWNKGKGGNGYLRFSRAWDCLIYANVSRGLRHLTMQWSSSGNVVIGNDLSSDLNMHGGWEHANLMENNVQDVPFHHRSSDCASNCGGADEPGGEGGAEAGTWYPIWNGVGHHSGKWSGSTGPRNVFFRNAMRKQLTEGGPFTDFLPYSTPKGGSNPAIFQFNWDRETPEGSHWLPLSKAGADIQDWTGEENTAFYAEPNKGINALKSDARPSLFAADAEALKAFLP